MKKYTFLLPLLFCSIALSAQQTYVPSSFSKGDSASYLGYSLDKLPEISTAASSWKYTFKGEPDTLAQVIRAVSDVPDGSHFPNAEIVEDFTDGIRVFLKKETDGLYMTGVSQKDPEMEMNYEQPVKVMSWPPQSETNSGTRTYSTNGLSFKGSGTITITVSEPGDLKVNGKTYKDAMLVVVDQNFTDIDKTYKSETSVKVKTYAWYLPGEAYASLKIDEISVKSAMFSFEEKLASILIQ